MDFPCEDCLTLGICLSKFDVQLNPYDIVRNMRKKCYNLETYYRVKVSISSTDILRKIQEIEWRYKNK